MARILGFRDNLGIFYGLTLSEVNSLFSTVRHCFDQQTVTGQTDPDLVRSASLSIYLFIVMGTREDLLNRR